MSAGTAIATRLVMWNEDDLDATVLLTTGRRVTSMGWEFSDGLLSFENGGVLHFVNPDYIVAAWWGDAANSLELRA